MKRKKQQKVQIVGIAVVVLILLLILIIFRPLFVGKAIETTAGNKIDFSLQNGKLFGTLTVAEEVNGLSFDLAIDGTSCGQLTFTSPLAWEFEEVTCTNGIYSFGTASMTQTQQGTFSVVEISPTTTFPERFRVTLSNLQVLASGVDLFSGVADSGTFDFAPPAPIPEVISEPAAPSGESSGGGGKSLTCYRKWECSAWSSCSGGKQTRSCVDKNACTSSKTIGFKTYPVILLGPEKPSESKSCAVTAAGAPATSGGTSSAGGTGGGGGGGGGRREVGPSTCTRNWECSAWSNCAAGKQTRTCTDLSACLSPEKAKTARVTLLGGDKPAQSKSCELLVEGAQKPVVAQPASVQVQEAVVTPVAEEKVRAAPLLVGAGVMLLLLAGGIWWYRRKTERGIVSGG